MNLPLTNSVYLFGHFFSEKSKKTQIDQSTLQVSYSVSREATHKPSKLAT